MGVLSWEVVSFAGKEWCDLEQLLWQIAEIRQSQRSLLATLTLRFWSFLLSASLWRARASPCVAPLGTPLFP